MTRTYTTRHGAGPLPCETDGKPHARIEDATNIANEFQGALRFGWLEPAQLVSDIRADLASAGTNAVTPNLVVTCADQIDGPKLSVVVDGHRREESFEEVLSGIKAGIGGARVLVACGPTRRDVRVGG